MRLAAIVQRLQDQCPGVAEVLLALSGAEPKRYPAAYVLPLAEAAESSDVTGIHEQRVRARFAVEWMVKQVSKAATGGPAQEALEDLRDAGKAALCGWSPEAAYTPIDFSGGKLIDFSPGFAVWRDEFVTEFYERNP